MVTAYAKENKEELATSGITVLEDEEGQVTLSDSTVASDENWEMYQLNFLTKENDLNKIIKNQRRDKKRLSILFISLWDEHSTKLLDKLKKKYSLKMQLWLILLQEKSTV